MGCFQLVEFRVQWLAVLNTVKVYIFGCVKTKLSQFLIKYGVMMASGGVEVQFRSFLVPRAGWQRVASFTHRSF